VKFKFYIHIPIPIVVTLLILCSCESFLDIKVGILWNDDPHVNIADSVYLGILQGKWDSESGFDSGLLDTAEVLVSVNHCYRFSINTNDSDNYTAFIFYDSNGNGKYDEGFDEVLGYKYNYGKAGGQVDISLSAYY
jgi:hypothetical protein